MFIVCGTICSFVFVPELNTAYCYSTIPHTAITPLSRQVLMMGMELPETC